MHILDDFDRAKIQEALCGPTWNESTSITREELLLTLRGGLWHVTRTERYSRIISSGGIDPNPEGVPDAERWQTLHGQRGFPFVRYVGGVSLFDFINWNIDKCAGGCVRNLLYCGWDNFIPVLRWDDKPLVSSVWIEINYNAVKDNLILNEELEHMQSDERKRSSDDHILLPCVEAAHIGRIPCPAFVRAFSVIHANKKIQPLSLSTSV